MTALNAGEAALELSILWERPVATDALTGQQFLAAEGQVRLTLPGLSGALLV